MRPNDWKVLKAIAELEDEMFPVKPTVVEIQARAGLSSKYGMDLVLYRLVSMGCIYRASLRLKTHRNYRVSEAGRAIYTKGVTHLCL